MLNDLETEYWTTCNVTNHHQFTSKEESLRFLEWRNAQYFNYERLMPFRGFDDHVIMDYGCGPGHDLVGFGHYSRPKKLYAVDVSPTSLMEAKSRLKIHEIQAEFIQLTGSDHRLPFEDNSIDYIHCSGVLHHITNYSMVLKEFRRILKPEKFIRVMVYNYNSIFVHLYVAYIKQIVEDEFRGEDIRKAFSKYTDGPNCPKSDVFRPSEFINICRSAGLSSKFLGAAISAYELSILPKRFEAIMSMELAKEHRDFLSALTFDEHGFPMIENEIAGVDGCFELTKG